MNPSKCWSLKLFFLVLKKAFLQVITILRCLYLKQTFDAKWKKLRELEPHEEARKKNGKWVFKNKTLLFSCRWVYTLTGSWDSESISLSLVEMRRWVLLKFIQQYIAHSQTIQLVIPNATFTSYLHQDFKYQEPKKIFFLQKQNF